MARLVSWLAGKAVVYAAILALLLGIFIVKVVPPMVVRYHQKELKEAIAELDESKALVGELRRKADDLGEGIRSRTEELRQMEERRQAMERLWERLKNLFRGDEVEAERKRMEDKERRLREEIGGLAREKRRLLVQGGETEDEIRRREVLRDEKEKQLREAEEMRRVFDDLMRNQLRGMAWKALLIVAALTFAPILWKLAAYYLVAPLAESAKPIVLAPLGEEDVRITATASHPAQRVSLGEDEVMMTKVDYLQGSMGRFEKRTKWLMDLRYPFSSLATGLFILTRIRNTGGAAGQVTLSTHEDATEELAVVDVPEGASVVFRPHYLVAVVHPAGRPPRIRSRWVFGRLHAWVNLRFRYLIMEGPVRMALSAQRGVQCEEVSPDHPGRRVNSNLTAVFSPGLLHSPRRAETFVAYLRGKNALFDDFFQGSGLVIQQQVTGGKRNAAARIWEGVFGAIGKVFGI